jgi:ADP-ribosylglycohydrolase
LKNKYLGCFFGAAIGDSLGMPNEDVTRKKSEEYYPGGIVDFTTPHPNTHCCALKAGQYTDDTQIMMALAQSLIDNGRFAPQSCVERLIEWYQVETTEKRYRGETTKNAIKKLIQGIPWEKSGIDSAGCGGATRAVPFGLFFFGDLDKIVECSSAQCQITHNNQIAKDGAVCVAVTIDSLLNGSTDPLGELQKMVKTQEFKEKLGNVELAIRNKMDLSSAIQTLGNSSLTTDVVGLSLFIHLSDPIHFEKSVLLAANATGNNHGDTDSIAFLVGAFSGAYNGIDKIRKDWVERIENSQQLRLMAEQLYDIASKRTS